LTKLKITCTFKLRVRSRVLFGNIGKGSPDHLIFLVLFRWTEGSLKKVVRCEF